MEVLCDDVVGVDMRDTDLLFADEHGQVKAQVEGCERSKWDL